jgi:hypothetical protein
MNTKSLRTLLSLLVLALVAFTRVENPETPVLSEKPPGGAPAPTITSITPPVIAFAAVDTLTITGTNFSSVASENIVYFNSTPVPIITNTTTSFVVKAPNMVLDSIKVRIARYKAEALSNTVYYKLDAAYSETPKLAANEEPWSAATDSAGNLYVSMAAGGGIGIKKFPYDGSARVDYAPAGGITKFSGMKMGPLGELYAGRAARAIYKIPAGGGTPAIWVSFGALGNVYDLDFDVNKNVWAGGTNTSIYRIRPDRNVRAFPFDAEVRTVRVYNGFVYFGGKTRPDNQERVMRAQIFSADSLGVFEEYYNFTTSPYFQAGKAIFGITFASDGSMYLSTDATNPILLVKTDRSATILYPGVISPTHHSFAWGNGPYLYALRGTSSAGVVTAASKIFRINTLKQSAPYLGR